MEKYKIHLYDLNRILQGQVPTSFYIEVIIRAFAVYVILIVALRLMGKRMTTRLNRTELGALSTIAAAVGAPIQSPERGLIPAALIVGIVILLQRWVNGYSAKNQRFEELVLGKIHTLVQDGYLQLENMKKIRVSRERVFAQLRSSQITNLGQIQRMYMEANGSFTSIKSEEKKSGLSVIPEWDTEFLNEQQKDNSKVICSYCGFEKQNENIHQCPNCKKITWVAATW
jgi:uncharacterized membrane protein YcaP (DUF421 family)